MPSAWVFSVDIYGPANRTAAGRELLISSECFAYGHAELPAHPVVQFDTHGRRQNRKPWCRAAGMIQAIRLVKRIVLGSKHLVLADIGGE